MDGKESTCIYSEYCQVYVINEFSDHNSAHLLDISKKKASDSLLVSLMVPVIRQHTDWKLRVK